MQHKKPAIGLWGAPCCIEDVQQIKDKEDLEGCLDEDDLGEWWSFGYYDTKQELINRIIETDGN